MQRARQPGQGTYLEANWLKPLPPAMKCNVDCTLFNNNTITGYGICIRDSSGQLVLGMSDFASLSSSPPEAKRLGLLVAIKLAITRGFPSFMFVLDCKLVVDAVNSSQIAQNEVGDIISRCKICCHLIVISLSIMFGSKQIRLRTL
jgi:hypothetical protein